MRFIAEGQNANGWTNFAEGRVTRQIRNMQALYTGNMDTTYTVNYWMRDFVRKRMGLSHKSWLARNLMKHHKTNGMIAIKSNEELLRESTAGCSMSSLQRTPKWATPRYSIQFPSWKHCRRKRN